jgi:class 3 adenylate cyclase
MMHRMVQFAVPARVQPMPLCEGRWTLRSVDTTEQFRRAPEGDGMAGLPTGTVTFLFTDLEGSTRLWEQHSEAMHGALSLAVKFTRNAGAVGGAGRVLFCARGVGLPAGRAG